MKLKKAANILFLVGAILAIVWAVGYLAGGIATAVLAADPTVKDLFFEAAQKADPQATAETIEAAYMLFQTGLTSSSVFCFICLAFCVPSCIFAFKARNSDNKAFFILNIVFGILSWTIVNVVGAVFALIKGNTLVNEQPVAEVEAK